MNTFLLNICPSLHWLWFWVWHKFPLYVFWFSQLRWAQPVTFCCDISNFSPKFTQLLDGNVASVSLNLLYFHHRSRGEADVIVATNFALSASEIALLQSSPFGEQNGFYFFFYSNLHTGFLPVTQIDHSPWFSQANSQNYSCTQIHTRLNWRPHTHPQKHTYTQSWTRQNIRIFTEKQLHLITLKRT